MLPRSLFLIIVASCWLQINAVPFQSRDDYQELQDDGEDLLDYAFAENEGVESVEGTGGTEGTSGTEGTGGTEDTGGTESTGGTEGNDGTEGINGTEGTGSAGGAEGAESSGGSEGSETGETGEGSEDTTAAQETPNKTSIIETVKDTMETMDKLGVLKDKNNINVNANSPKYKKKAKKTKQNSRKRIRPKTDENDMSRRSSQQFPKKIPEDSQIINERKRKIAGVKSRNHCLDARRSVFNNYSRSINLNSSYLGIDEDFTIKSQAKMKKTHAVFTDDYITLCWIETTTIKTDNSTNPPKRLVLRESTITFENAAAIPDEYLSCPEVNGDISLESPEAVCNTSFGENIGDDTRYSRAVNLTRSIRDGNIDIEINKLIKCTMGSVITKDVYRWLNPSESTRQRVEIKVSPETYSTEELCTKYLQEPNLDTIHPKNESAECSDESEQDGIKDKKEKGKNATVCSGEGCSNEESTKSPDITTEPSSTVKEKGTVTQPSDLAGINDKLPMKTPKTSDAIPQSSGHPGTADHLPTSKPLFVSKTEHTKSHPVMDDHSPTLKPLFVPKTGDKITHSGLDDHLSTSKPIFVPKKGDAKSHQAINDHLPTSKPIFVPKTGDIMPHPSGHPGVDDHSSTAKPLFVPKPEDTMSHSTIRPETVDKLLATKSPGSSELNDESLIVAESPAATKAPKILFPSEHGVHSAQQIPVGDMTIAGGKPHNITGSSDEESCTDSDCEDIESISDAEIGEVSTPPHGKVNGTTSSEEFLEREKHLLYIPKPFICPVKNKVVCDHLERVSQLQGSESSSDEDEVQVANELKELAASEESLSSEMGGVELGDFVPFAITATMKPGAFRTVSTIALPKSQSTEHITPTHELKSETSPGIDSHNSESISSSENISDELKAILSSEESVSMSSSGTKLPEIFVNRTQMVTDSSYGGEIESSSQEMERTYGSNETVVTESCDEFGNCHESNSSDVSRVTSPPGSQTNGLVPPLIGSNDTKSHPGLHEDEEEGSDESCDCDEESVESTKCDPQSGACEPDSDHTSDNKLVTRPMLNGDAAEPQRENMTTVSGRQGPTSATMTDKDRVKGIGLDGEAAEKLLQNHKLSLKIHVTLEHIDENKENYELAEVEKDVLLNELPEQHGNHSLYWHIKALNESENNIDSLRDMFNCTLLEKLTEEAIIDRLNMTQLGGRMAVDDDDDENDYGRRRRRSADNSTSTSNSNNLNESPAGHSVIKECILPNIREDIKNGLADMLSQILAVLNNSRNSTSVKTNDNATARRGDTDSSETSKTTPVTNRNRRSLISISGGSDSEELSRWSNERFTPSNDGGQLRSFTELKILKNPVGVK